ncbi:MAG: hypothetical protein U9Q69_02350 [Nanoarchaeota archaeon]|nr:hypothetical protein [Nanoarchaeota archaeon]
MTQQKLKESADLFHEVHFVEKWGKGIGKILELEPKTEFKELGRKFYNIFRKKEVQEKEGERLTQKIWRKILVNLNKKVY